MQFFLNASISVKTDEPDVTNYIISTFLNLNNHLNKNSKFQINCDDIILVCDGNFNPSWIIKTTLLTIRWFRIMTTYNLIVTI